ncbi:UNVERIFIED_CONTAM: hypothetical protein GTU68_018423 [Idotea baltica]|nr:hypothetical protein [Idotea baltica]
MKDTYPSVLGAIGQTPLIRLDRLVALHGLSGTILAKLDHLNPGFSKKDRAALGVIEEAEREGWLKPGQTVVELTSGNMGTGLAIVCAVKGYPFVAVMSEGNSKERARMMRALGAEVVLVPQSPDLALVEARAVAETKARSAFRADQFQRAGNWHAHFHGTGPEIWAQSEGGIDGFVDFAGSGGTYAGVARYLKSQDASIQCFVLEPDTAATLAGDKVSDPSHPIQGGGYAMQDLAFMQETPVDGYLKVGGGQARHVAHDLARTEGIFAGFSAGANVAAALDLLAGPMQGKTIAVIICDSGLKYLSTDLWED